MFREVLHSLGGVPGEVRQVMASQACLASPVSSWPGLSEAWAADREKGARAAVKTKMDKRFILSYSVKLEWEVRGGFQGPSEISDGFERVG